MGCEIRRLLLYLRDKSNSSERVCYFLVTLPASSVKKKAIFLLKTPGVRHTLELQWTMTNLKFSWIFSDLTLILGMEERGRSMKKIRNLCSEKKILSEKLLYIPQGRISHLHRGGRLKYCTVLTKYFHWKHYFCPLLVQVLLGLENLSVGIKNINRKCN